MSEGHTEWVTMAGGKKKPIGLDECTNCLHFLEIGHGRKIQKNGCNSKVGPGFPMGLREDGGSVLEIGTPVRFGAQVGCDVRCTHKHVRPI